MELPVGLLGECEGVYIYKNEVKVKFYREFGDEK